VPRSEEGFIARKARDEEKVTSLGMTVVVEKTLA
jgi:hypothetical protein